MKNRLWMCGALISGCAVQMNPARCSDSDFASESEISGKAVQVAFNVREGLQTHFNFSFISGSASLTENYVSNSDLKLASFDSMLDWHPVTGGFFVSGGAVTGMNKTPGTTQSNISQGRVSALVAGSAGSAADVRNVAPYLGLGWTTQKAKTRGWRMTSDLGILYRGRTTLSLNNTNCLMSNVGAFSMCQGFDYGNPGVNMVDARNGLMRYVPVLRAGISYLF